MFKTNKMKSAIIVLLMVFTAIPVSSATAQESSWYIGAGVGNSEFDTGVTGLTGSASLDEDDTGFKIFGGYQFNDYIAAEAFYANFGESSLSGNSGDTFNAGGTAWQFIADNATINAEAQSVGLGGVFSYPLSKVSQNKIINRISPFVKLGVHYWDTEMSATASGVNRTTTDDDGLDLYYGAGVNVDIHEHFAFRAEYEVYGLDHDLDITDDVNYLSANIIYKF